MQTALPLIMVIELRVKIFMLKMITSGNRQMALFICSMQSIENNTKNIGIHWTGSLFGIQLIVGVVWIGSFKIIIYRIFRSTKTHWGYLDFRKGKNNILNQMVY